MDESDKHRSNWHAQEIETVLQDLESRTAGLSPQEVQTRLERYGPNRLQAAKQRSPLVRFLAQFNNTLIYVLLIASVMTALLEHWVDTGVIIAVVLLNALIGFIQEGKAEKALDAIRNMLSQYASVLRGGAVKQIKAEELVPGDIVQLHSGDKVPADLRLFATVSLQIDESILTGESVPAEKSDEATADDALPGDRFGMAFSGTLVTYGQASGVVVATANDTEIGRISALLERVEILDTPLMRQMASFGQWLTAAIGLIATLTFAFGVLFRDYTASEMFMAAVGLAVAAIPEGLPAIMTITLAIGVQRMAKRNSIIRRLLAVETLGSVMVICSDKTGTLTKNEMTVQAIVTSNHHFTVNGAGYDPHGSIALGGKDVSLVEHPILEELVRAASLCNDAVLSETDKQWTIHGDPTEAALMTLASKAGLGHVYQSQQWPRTDVIPFESEHRFMATLHHDHAGHGFIYIKGAPERILSLCTSQRHQGEDKPINHLYWEKALEKLAGNGQRLLAVAFKTAQEGRRELQFSDLEGGLTLLGFVGMIDPPRDEAIAAVSRCKSAGISVKMITGDHAITAAAIGLRMHIGDGKAVISGHELEELSDAQLCDVVQRVDIFARSSPEHKLRLVKAMQANGSVVAMTGDGVNDAPALKRADVGVAMGLNGTEVAKEAAEMVLVDDNFASIAHAVEEGRTVYDNIRKSILFILPTNGGEALTIIAAIMLGTMLPITPVQILWVNMITAVTLALALAFEPSESNVMLRRPRKPSEPLLSGLFIWRIVFVSLILVTGTFGLFFWERLQGESIEVARTIAVNTLVMFEIFYVFNSRYISEPVLNRAGLFGNRYVLWAVAVLVFFQLLFTYLSPAQLLFGTAAISLLQWGKIIAVASTVLFLVEIEKAFVRHVSKDKKKSGRI